MIYRYEILEFISQGEDREVSPENERISQIANDIRRAVGSCTTDEGKHGVRDCNGAILNDLEKRCSEQWAKKNNCWIPFDQIFKLGIPGPSGSESDTYISEDKYVFKVNNLLHCQDSIIILLTKTMIYNELFPDSSYTLIGFTGFEGRSIYPVLRQEYISKSRPATQNEIDCYMAACCFEKIGDGRYVNDKYEVWDVLPKNVLKDETGDMFVIDLEIKIK